MVRSRRLDPALMEALGNLVSGWSFVEAMLNEFLAFLLGADKGYAYILTQSVSNSTVTDWIKTGVTLRDFGDHASNEITMLLQRIEGVRAERNALVHGTWNEGPEPNTAMVQTVRLERRDIIVRQLVTVPDLHELINEIEGITSDLAAIARGLGYV